jgi:hypothetical protein
MPHIGSCAVTMQLCGNTQPNKKLPSLQIITIIHALQLKIKQVSTAWYESIDLSRHYYCVLITMIIIH